MTARNIVTQVAERFGVHRATVMGVTRTKSVAAARHRAMHEIRLHLGWSYHEIGSFFKRDSSTVIHALRRIEHEDLTACGGVYP